MMYNPQKSINKIKELIDFCEQYQYSILRCNILEGNARVIVNECCDILNLTYDNGWKVKNVEIN